MDGFQSPDKTAMFVYETIASYYSFFCSIIESNSQKTFFFFVLCTNMAAMTSSENYRQYIAEYLSETKFPVDATTTQNEHKIIFSYNIKPIIISQQI